MSDDTKNSNCQKTHKKTLRIFPYGFNLKIAPKSPQANRRTFKQTKGGNVDTRQPPTSDSGFFVPATFNGDINILSSVARNKIPLMGNTCSVSFWTLEGTRQLYCCENFKNLKGTTAMNNANTHGLTTSVVATTGASSTQCNECLLPSSVLADAIHQAKAQAANGGKFGTANGYAQLLKSFHAAILPSLIHETNGNISKMSRLLGLDRKSVIKYAESVGLLHLLGAGQGGAKQ